ncbi:MAG: hypothetical protein JWR44_3274 [Hymenobacter sp.]|nr:hypothetical protein [Hymenobacter sp.]
MFKMAVETRVLYAARPGYGYKKKGIYTGKFIKLNCLRIQSL